LGDKNPLTSAAISTPVRPEALWRRRRLKARFKSSDKIAKRSVADMNGYDNFDIEVREGIPYVEIQKFARINAGGLIFMANHTRQLDPEKAVQGDTVQQVFFRYACAVTSVNYPDKVADL
jgi:nucleotide-binding universal stress UspA family protein